MNFRHFLLSFLLLLFSFSSRAERGEIISYELLRDWDGRQVADFFYPQFIDMIPPGSEDSILALLYDLADALLDNKTVKAYRIVYKTIDAYGAPTQASGLILLPSYTEVACELPVMLYGHGTIFARYTVPSYPDNWGSEEIFPYFIAACDYVAVVPDYYGLGDGPGFHHHNYNRTNPSSSIDAIRAARNLCADLEQGLNGQVFISGYSEGGTTAMGTLKMINDQNLSSEFQIVSAGCGSGAYDLSDLAFNFIANNPYYPTRQYILYITATCEDIYGNVIREDLGETYSTYLKPPYDQMYVDHILGQDGFVDWVPLPWTDMFQPGVYESIINNPHHPVRDCLAAGNVYKWQNFNETHLYFCKTDQQVPWRGAVKTRNTQQRLIPPNRFWERFKIQTHDMTMNGDVESHEMCAIPSMMHYVIISNLKNEFRCSQIEGRSGKSKAHNFLMHYDKSIILPEYEAGSLRRIELIDIVNGKTVQLNPKRIENNIEISLQEANDGVYLMKYTDVDGKKSYGWQVVESAQFVETDDYDPISESNGFYSLDLSLLEEEVSKVVLYTESGEKIRTYTSLAKSLELAAKNELNAGKYVVEVQMRARFYHLNMEVANKNNNLEISINPNPAGDHFEIKGANIENIRIYNASGTEYKVPSSSSGTARRIDIQSIPAGLYFILIYSPEGLSIKKLVKF